MSGDMIEVGLKLLKLMNEEKITRAAAAKRLGLSISQARFRQAAAERHLKHPRNKQHPLRKLVLGQARS
jgi:hypothetical protein